MVGEPANPFATPLEILPEWYLYPAFQILRVVPNKLLGVVLQTLIPLGLMCGPLYRKCEQVSKSVSSAGSNVSVSIWHCCRAVVRHRCPTFPIDKSLLTLGLF